MTQRSTRERDEKLAEIKEKADAALKKATAEGADFDAVVKGIQQCIFRIYRRRTDTRAELKGTYFRCALRCSFRP